MLSKLTVWYRISHNLSPFHTYLTTYLLVNKHKYGKSPCLMRKSNVDIYKWQFSVAMFNSQRLQHRYLTPRWENSVYTAFFPIAMLVYHSVSNPKLDCHV